MTHEHPQRAMYAHGNSKEINEARHVHQYWHMRSFLSVLFVIGGIALISKGAYAQPNVSTPFQPISHKVTIQVPVDSQGRSMIGAGTESTLTIHATGNDPVTVTLRQQPTKKLGAGLVYFGTHGDKTTATVTTSGGSRNAATIPVRGDRNHPSTAHHDLMLTASVNHVVVTKKPITVLRVAVDEPSTTLLNDMSVIRTITTTPATPNLSFDVQFFRSVMKDGKSMWNPKTETFSSVYITPEHGSRVITGPDGSARFYAQAGHGGQGWVYGHMFIDELEYYIPIEFDLTQPCFCDVCCMAERANSEDSGDGAIGLYAGERHVQATDLSILGRGMDFDSSRVYRSQASHLRSAGSGDFGVDWAMTYIDDRLIPDGHNVIVSRPTLRTDVFMASEIPGQYIAPMEFYEQLTLNHDGNFELRNRDGMIQTYKGFSDHEFPGRLIRQEDRNGNFLSFLYDRPKGLSKTVLTTVVDSMGRTIHYRYYNEQDPNPGRRGRLKAIEDFRRDNSKAGRRITYDYDPEGNLISVTSPRVIGTPNGNDFPYGKTVQYRYTRESDVPEFLKDKNRQRLLHNLVAVQYPNETAVELDPENPQTLHTKSGTFREVSTYGVDASSPETFDRVITYTLGGLNSNGVPAGGTLHYDYDILTVKAATPNDPYLRNMVTDRRGNVTKYVFSPFDTLLEKREFTRGFRKQEPKAFVSTYRYNLDKELVQELMPEGNRIDYTFDERNPDRFQQGNRIRSVQTPDSKRGGDQDALFNETVYEPIYQQPAAITDSRGLDPLFLAPLMDTSSRSQRERYTTKYFFDYQEGPVEATLPLLAEELGTTVHEVHKRLDRAGIQLGLGDLNDNGVIEESVAGNIIREVKPSVTLLSDSQQASIEGDRLQNIVTMTRFNQFGQMTSQVDPESNVDIWTYFPETDPDGDGNDSAHAADRRTLDTNTGGYLAQEKKDTVANPKRNNKTNPHPTNIRMSYTRDDVGNQTSMVDGRGIRTDNIVNQLNQVMQTIRAAAVPQKGEGSPPESMDLVAFRYLENTFYDFNNNVTQHQVEDRGNTSNTGGFVDYTYKYDILDNQIEKTEEVDVNETLVHRLRHDANGNVTLTIWPEGNAVSHRYDERDLKIQSIRGALYPTDETLGAPEKPYDPRGGTPSTMTWNYDKNRNVVEAVDAADTDGALANNSLIAGVGDVFLTVFDGFDRPVLRVDAVGNETRYLYDPVSNEIQITRRGLIDGSSPNNMRGTNNVDLETTQHQYDELNRAFQTDRFLFIAQGVKTQRPPNVTDAELTPGDHKVSTRYEYDRNSRETFRIEDDLDTYRTDYDGSNRNIRITDPEQNTVERAYDDNNNLIEMLETDISQIEGVSKEAFLTTYFFDSLDRIQRQVDNLGQAQYMRYDSRNNLVALGDAQGPLAGVSIERRAFPDGGKTVNRINQPGNVVLLQYDGINRKVSEDQILTNDGQGDGVVGVTLEGIRSNPQGPRNIPGVLSPDPSQSTDGLISLWTDWDQDSLRASLTDDNGNQTLYRYDNLNRLIAETKGLVVAPRLADRADSGTTIRMEYDRDNNLLRRTDENGSVVICDFDAINRRIACHVNRAPRIVGTTEVSYTYDGLSRLKTATDNNDPDRQDDDSTVTYAYDSLNRVIEEIQRIGNQPPKIVSSSWRAENQRIGLTYPNDRVLALRYDGLDRLATVGDQRTSHAIAEFKFIGANRVLERRYPMNGTSMTYLNDSGNTDIGYDGLRRPIRLRHLRADHSQIVGFTHGYDRMNNKLEELKLHHPPHNEVYGYDSIYRLIDFRRPDSSAIMPQYQRWTLDGVSNWKQVDSETRQHSSFNELVTRNGSALDYDNNGNQIDDDTFLFQWDYNNRLRTVTRKENGGIVAQYDYDAKNRRIRKVTDNDLPLKESTHFLYDGWQVIEERDQADGVVQQYVFGVYIDEALVMDRNLNGDRTATGSDDQRLFYHHNTLYSVFALTGIDAMILEGYQYDAYGRPAVFSPSNKGVLDFAKDAPVSIGEAGAVRNPYLYTGRRFDGETTLYYYRNRYYSQDLGRFISRDPINYVDGMNLYAYVTARVTANTDPMGFASWQLLKHDKIDTGTVKYHDDPGYWYTYSEDWNGESSIALDYVAGKKSNEPMRVSASMKSAFSYQQVALLPVFPFGTLYSILDADTWTARRKLDVKWYCDSVTGKFIYARGSFKGNTHKELTFADISLTVKEDYSNNQRHFFTIGVSGRLGHSASITSNTSFNAEIGGSMGGEKSGGTLSGKVGFSSGWSISYKGGISYEPSESTTYTCCKNSK